MPEGITQDKYRMPMNGRDRFGRRYLYSLEQKSQQPSGQITTCFQDPLKTPQKYLSVDTRRPYTVRIDFDAWVRDLEEAWRDRERRKNQLKRQMAHIKADELADLLGPEPTKVEHVQAAKAGNWKYLSADGKEPKKPAKAEAASLVELEDDEVPEGDEDEDEGEETAGTPVGSRARTGR